MARIIVEYLLWNKQTPVQLVHRVTEFWADRHISRSSSTACHRALAWIPEKRRIVVRLTKIKILSVHLQTHWIQFKCALRND